MRAGVFPTELRRLLYQVLVFASKLVLFLLAWCPWKVLNFLLACGGHLTFRAWRRALTNEFVHIVHDVVDVVVELFGQSNKLLGKLRRKVQGALVQEVVEILLRDLGLQDFDPHDILVVIVRRYYDISLFFVLVIGAVVILRCLLDVAALESFDFRLFILVLRIFVLILLFVVILVLISDSTCILPVHPIIHLLIIRVLHLFVSLIVVLLLILELVFIILLVVLLALTALSVASFTRAYLRVRAKLFIGGIHLTVQVDRHLLPVSVIERPIPVDLCNELLDLLLL